MNKSKRKRTINSARSPLAPTKERRRQNGGVVRERSSDGRMTVDRYRAVWECPLDAYRDQGLISDAQHRAGLRFRSLYYSAVITRPHNDCRPISIEQANMEPTMPDRLLNKAYDTLASDEIKAVVDVCGFSEHIWNPRAYEKMRKGLGHLAVQWNMAAVEVCGL